MSALSLISGGLLALTFGSEQPEGERLSPVNMEAGTCIS